jgi:hypothetical protein
MKQEFHINNECTSAGGCRTHVGGRLIETRVLPHERMGFKLNPVCLITYRDVSDSLQERESLFFKRVELWNPDNATILEPLM